MTATLSLGFGRRDAAVPAAGVEPVGVDGFRSPSPVTYATIVCPRLPVALAESEPSAAVKMPGADAAIVTGKYATLPLLLTASTEAPEPAS